MNRNPRKHNPNKGYKRDWIDFNLDGASRKRRVKDKDKIYMKKLTRSRIKKDTEIEISEYLDL